ncbi:MAG: hypothetical protein WD872_15110 [Pirellulaceae bacterium]
MSGSAARRQQLRVVKVGGSLLDWPPLAPTLARWLGEQAVAHQVLVAGGGKLADFVRQADRSHCLGEAAAHWLSIDAMSVTARLLAALLGDRANRLTSLGELQARLAADDMATVVFDCSLFLRDSEPQASGTALPHTWDVTSDSIAARLAEFLQADELVLLKSQAPPPQATLADLAERGYVDRFFPTAAQAIPAVRSVNLREC